MHMWDKRNCTWLRINAVGHDRIIGRCCCSDYRHVRHFYSKSFQEHLLLRIYYSYKYSQIICRCALFSQMQILQFIFNTLSDKKKESNILCFFPLFDSPFGRLRSRRCIFGVFLLEHFIQLSNTLIPSLRQKPRGKKYEESSLYSWLIISCNLKKDRENEERR